MTFDLGEYYDLTGSIGHRLGILRGNEAVKEWWAAWQAELDAAGAPRAGWLGYQSTPAEPEYWVDFMYHGMPEFEGDQDAQYPQIDKVNGFAAQAYANGRSWAIGMSGYLDEICASFIRCDAAKLRETASEFESVRVQFEGAVPAAWTDLTVDDWIGQASDKFAAFISQLFDSMIQYQRYFAYAENEFAAAATLVDRTQSGLIQFLRTVNDNLHDQLIEWSITQGSPFSHSGPNPKVADIAAVGRQIIGFFKPVDAAVSTVEDIVGVTTGILGLFGVDTELIKPDEPFDLESATTIYSGLTDVLYNSYLVPFNEQLEELSTHSQQVRAAITGMGSSWWPTEVNRARSPEWEHALEP